MQTKLTAIAVAAALFGSGASAATLSWTSYDKSELAQAQSDRALIDTDTLVAFEDFESFSPVTSNATGSTTPLATAVGVFTTTAGNRCGGSCLSPDDESLVRNATNYGRYNTTSGGSQWLDSNDNEAINLAADGGVKFDSLSFFLTDIDDVGPVTFSIDVEGQVFDIASDVFGGQRQGNADLFLVQIGFGSLVDTATLSLIIDDGDGFGLDDVRLGSSVSPVPVPASLPLLAAGLGLMGWMKRRRKA